LGRWELSSKELSRAEVMGRVKAGSLRLREGAELLEVSYRQVKRVWARYREGGGKALQHRNCGRQSNRAYGVEFRRAMLKQVKSRYQAELNRRYARAVESADYHRRRPTSRSWTRCSGWRKNGW
jgi:hypothetical protein